MKNIINETDKIALQKLLEDAQNKHNKAQMDKPNFQEMLENAVKEPGKIAEAYSLFHNYSISNAWLALWECAARGIEPGPINTYKGWMALNRQVKKGSKAIRLIMPVTCKIDSSVRNEETGEYDPVKKTFTRFLLKPYWFVLSQTDGEDVALPSLPSWDAETALAALNMQRIPFDGNDGNTQGFAMAGRKLAISPIAFAPHKTLFHEMAHILLGHCESGNMLDFPELTKSLKEVEAESVAYLVTSSLKLDGLEYARGYIQHWLQGSEIPGKNAQRIFSTANQILKAGTIKEIEA